MKTHRRPTAAELEAAAVVLAALLSLPQEHWIAALAIVCRAHWDGRLDGLLADWKEKTHG